MELAPALVLAVVGIVAVTRLAPRVGVAAPLLLVLLGVLVSFVPGAPSIEIEPEWILAGIAGRRRPLNRWLSTAAHPPPAQIDRQVGHQRIQIGVGLGLQSGAQPLIQFVHTQPTVRRRLLEQRGDEVPLAMPDPDIAVRGRILSHVQTLPNGWADRTQSPSAAATSGMPSI